MFKSGDIVVSYRKKYEGPFKFLMTRLICFFTTEWWKGEETSKTFHAEMIYSPSNNINEIKDISQEWPCVKITSFRHLNRRAIFRLRNKPPNFDSLFFEYCNQTLGQKYDWLKLIGLAFVWLFRMNWWARLFSLKNKDICSEYVARFYQDWIQIPCSSEKANFTTPDHILDYCLEYPKLFEVIHLEER